MLTEPQLWKKLNELWSQAKPYTGSNMSRSLHHIHPFPGDITACGHEPCFGLCQSIIRFKNMKEITERTFESAQRRLSVYLHSHGWNKAYLFSLDAEGAGLRAAVCREMLEEVRRVV